MSYTPKQASYHFEIGCDQYEVNFKLKGTHYMVIVFCNNRRMSSHDDSLECSTGTAATVLSNYLTKKNNPIKLF